MSYTKLSLAATLGLFLCLSCDALGSQVLQKTNQDIWGEIARYLPSNNRFLNDLSRLILLPAERYDAIVRGLITAQENIPLEEEIDSWITRYFETTKYIPRGQFIKCIKAAFRKIIQNTAHFEPYRVNNDGLDPLKSIKWDIAHARYHIKLEDRLANQANPESFLNRLITADFKMGLILGGLLAIAMIVKSDATISEALYIGVLVPIIVALAFRLSADSHYIMSRWQTSLRHLLHLKELEQLALLWRSISDKALACAQRIRPYGTNQH